MSDSDVYSVVSAKIKGRAEREITQQAVKFLQRQQAEIEELFRKTSSRPKELNGFSLDNLLAIKALIPFEIGYKAHQETNYKDAWECFSGLAECGNKFAKYWKGYYLLFGYHIKKDMDTALKLFKQAADNFVLKLNLDMHLFR
ncbi:hypothetical protein C2G38_2037212 [Gigaspora rosea]|uniref:Uncharacterized protein n=1 Tax=Gigaspora rosea TaxID=44941 RepID=A0A397V7M8_9GLOM|nr:hypothetical protein C2G38_2037212 [Gigaspora rosea]